MIKLSLESKQFYRLEIIKGSASFATDKQKVQTLADRQAIYRSEQDIELFSHWVIPRENIGFILRKFNGRDIIMSKKVAADVAVYRDLMRPLSELPKSTRKVTIARPGIVLKPDQDRWVRLDENRKRVLNTFQTGEGKTLASLTRCRFMRAKRTIIFTISGVFDQWEDEIRTVYGEDQEAVIYAGSIKQRAALREKVKNAKFVITNHEVGHEIAHFDEFDSYIFDEHHLLCNPATRKYKRLAKTFKQTWKNPDNLVQILTATPMGSIPSNLWTIVRLVHPLLAGTHNAFKRRYERVEETREINARVSLGDGRFVFVKKKVPKSIKHQNRTALKELLSALMMQGDESESKKTYKDISKVTKVEMTEYQDALYAEFKEKLNPEINGKKFKTAEVRTKLLRLLQIAEGAYNLDPLDRSLRKESGKIRLLRRKLKSIQERDKDKPAAEREKVIVWFRFKEATKILKRIFGDAAVIYNGDLNRSQKLLAKWAFNGVKNDKQLAQYKILAARYGYTLGPGEAQFFFGVLHEKTSLGMDLQSCAYQIFGSFSFSGYAMAQTRGRICRIGQKAKRVITEYLVSAGTWEEHCLNYILERYKQVRMSLKGIEILNKDSTIKLLNILKRYG